MSAPKLGNAWSDNLKAIIREVRRPRVSAGRTRTAALGGCGGVRLVELAVGRSTIAVINKIPDDLGTAVTVMEMVFGNMGDDSGTGVAFTRDPNTGEKVLFGEYLRNAQGEDVVAGIRDARTHRRSSRFATRRLRTVRARSPNGSSGTIGDMQDLEFTVERGKLFMLQTRSAKRSAEAAVKIALDLVEEGVIDRRKAVASVDASSLDQLFHARIDASQHYETVGKGLNASPGAATGQIVFTADDAVAWHREGKPVVLVRIETTPDDVHGMIAAEGVLTAKGGATSHAAVVARGMGKPCVAGCDALDDRPPNPHAQISAAHTSRRATGSRSTGPPAR